MIIKVFNNKTENIRKLENYIFFNTSANHVSRL